MSVIAYDCLRAYLLIWTCNSQIHYLDMKMIAEKYFQNRSVTATQLHNQLSVGTEVSWTLEREIAT